MMRADCLGLTIVRSSRPTVAIEADRNFFFF